MADIAARVPRFSLPPRIRVNLCLSVALPPCLILFVSFVVSLCLALMPSPPETRASLILRLPDAADARAWDEFAAVYAPLVYRLARRQGLQPADADDLVQEVLSAVARSVEGWLASDEPRSVPRLAVADRQKHGDQLSDPPRSIDRGDGQTAMTWLGCWPSARCQRRRGQRVRPGVSPRGVSLGGRAGARGQLRRDLAGLLADERRRPADGEVAPRS